MTVCVSPNGANVNGAGVHCRSLVFTESPPGQYNLTNGPPALNQRVCFPHVCCIDGSQVRIERTLDAARINQIRDVVEQATLSPMSGV